MIGPAGGTVLGPNGAKVVIPPGALAANTTIAIEQTSAGAPALPTGATSFGPMFAFTPHGTTFAVPVTMTVPFDRASLPPGATPVLYKTNAAQTAFEEVAGGAISGATMTAQVTGFSNANVAQRVGPPLRRWEFEAFPGDSTDPERVAGQFEELRAVAVDDSNRGKHVFGSSFAVTPRGDRQAIGRVFSTANGRTYSVLAESPQGSTSSADSHIGSRTILTQHQVYRKDTDDATLKMVVTAVNLDGFDFGANEILPFECVGLRECRLQVLAGVWAQVSVLDGLLSPGGTDILSIREGQVQLENIASVGDPQGAPRWAMPPPSTDGDLNGAAPLWDASRFNFEPDVDGTGTHGRVTLKQPYSIDLDISRLPKGKEFTVITTVIATTFNQRQGETSVWAYFRDPVGEAGVSLETTGLTETGSTPAGPSVTQDFGQAPVCTTGIDPAAGVLQFSAAGFEALELPLTPKRLFVTRTGGSKGAISARFITSDGSAKAGTDYIAVTRTISFADGDSTPRAISVPILSDTIAGPDKTVNLVLSDVRGCAALGVQSTAVLTILDNDRPPPVNAFTLGGTVTGLVGSGLVLTNFGIDAPITGNGAFAFPLPLANGVPYEVRVKTQPANPSQICTVTRGSGTIAGANVTDVAIDCATPPPNGALDSTFGAGGKVTTASTGTGNAVALQADGKLVTVGGAFTLTRHNADGSPDASFGTNGKVTTAFGSGSGTANDVAIQADGKIVVAGSARARAGFASDDNFSVRRYGIDGSLDTSFGAGGIVDTDFAVFADVAKAVAIQADGKIVVAGQSQSASGIDFALVRYNSDGSLDAGFGSAGRLTTDIAGGIDFGSELVLQPDGKILVAGRFSPAGSSSVGGVALVRYNANGSLDAGFGTAGKVVLAGNLTADALALQSDGRIIVAGSVNAGSSTSAFGLTRFFADGSADSAFGTPTTSFFSGGNGTIGRAVAVQSDGKIVLVGEAAGGASSTFDVALARFDSSGSLDANFATGGKLLVDFFASTDSAQDVVIQPDGKIVIAGSARNGTSTEFALVRVNP